MGRVAKLKKAKRRENRHRLNYYKELDTKADLKADDAENQKNELKTSEEQSHRYIGLLTDRIQDDAARLLLAEKRGRDDAARLLLAEERNRERDAENELLRTQLEAATRRINDFDKQDDELKRLRHMLADRDDEIQRLMNASARVRDQEPEIASLKQKNYALKAQVKRFSRDRRRSKSSSDDDTEEEPSVTTKTASERELENARRLKDDLENPYAKIKSRTSRSYLTKRGWYFVRTTDDGPLYRRQLPGTTATQTLTVNDHRPDYNGIRESLRKADVLFLKACL